MKSSRLMIAGAVAALLPLAGAMAQSSTQPADPPQKGATFESLDANGDGKISKAEAAASAEVTAQFARYDQNSDGYIDRDEVSSTNQEPPASEPPQQ